MERISRLLLGFEAIPASLLLRFGAIITVNKGLSEHTRCDNAATNSNSENARSRMAASLRGSVGTGTKEDELSTGRVWAARYHHITARSRVARVLKHVPFINFPNFFSARGKPWITEIADTESADTGVHLCCYLLIK